MLGDGAGSVDDIYRDREQQMWRIFDCGAVKVVCVGGVGRGD